MAGKSGSFEFIVIATTMTMTDDDDDEFHSHRPISLYYTLSDQSIDDDIHNSSICSSVSSLQKN